jgi:catechol 2,3-dioxygenase-like lactoylglutathione lyase family enzyme
MPVQLNHTIVHASDKLRSARFVADVLGLPEPEPYGPFMVVRLANGVSLDFMTDPGPIAPQHYAFLVTDSEFDEIFARIRELRLPYWADPGKSRPGEYNTRDGGRGVYWEDLDGHFLEILTVPYGGA